MSENYTNSGLSYIAIEGVIGAGKTSVARMLSEKLNAKLILENFEDNPYGERFALHFIEDFLVKQVKHLRHGGKSCDSGFAHGLQ